MKYAPKITQIQIDPDKIGDVIGQKGKVINQIIAETDVKIDITDDGAVSICGVKKENIEKAIKMIQMIVSEFEAGRLYEGKVVSIKEFGAFLEFAPGKEGMVHISNSLITESIKLRTSFLWRCHYSKRMQRQDGKNQLQLKGCIRAS